MASTRSAASSRPATTNASAAPDRPPLRVDATRGYWNAIEELWAADELTDDYFIDDIIVSDIGEGTDGWDFPGAAYSVELR
ncbi:hypothetical protein OIE50_50670 [Streptomyces canus]|uniref:hypothetical protein n=1 Tax=Streptomyces canus TaxID=58343 RepID=UPI00324354A8